jgi:hypothetical protein
VHSSASIIFRVPAKIFSKKKLFFFLLPFQFRKKMSLAGVETLVAMDDDDRNSLSMKCDEQQRLLDGLRSKKRQCLAMPNDSDILASSSPPSMACTDCAIGGSVAMTSDDDDVDDDDHNNDDDNDVSCSPVSSGVSLLLSESVLLESPTQEDTANILQNMRRGVAAVAAGGGDVASGAPLRRTVSAPPTNSSAVFRKLSDALSAHSAAAKTSTSSSTTMTSMTATTATAARPIVRNKWTVAVRELVNAAAAVSRDHELLRSCEAMEPSALLARLQLASNVQGVAPDQFLAFCITKDLLDADGCVTPRAAMCRLRKLHRDRSRQEKSRKRRRGSASSASTSINSENSVNLEQSESQ